MRSISLAIFLSATGLWAQAVAVLPFANRSESTPGLIVQTAGAQLAGAQLAGTQPGGPQMDWIGESIAETLRDVLTANGLVTLSRDETVNAYRRLSLRPRNVLAQASALKIGEALDAEQVVLGTFEFTSDGASVKPPASEDDPPAAPQVRGTLKIAARILDRKHLKQGSEFLESGNLDDLPTLEAHLAWRTLNLIAPKSAPPEADFRKMRNPVRLDARENYVRGLLASTPAQQETYYMQSARLDPHFGHPLLLLGRMHYDRKEYRQAAEWLQKISETDVHFHEAAFWLGLALYQSGDPAGAQKAFQTLADAVPLNEVINNLGAAQSRRNLPQAADSFRKALEGDPNDPVYIFNYGYSLWKKNDFSAAAERFRAVLDREPGNQTATLLLGMCLKKQGLRPGDARLEAVERLKSNFDERAYQLLRSMVTSR